MDLVQLKYFTVVADTEHLTKAAELLYISQPSLSKAISRLESELGVQLFDREGNKIRLNEYGRVFLDRVNDVISSLDGGCREVREMAGLEHGRVKAASGFQELLNPLTREFLRRYPESYVSEATMTEAAMAEALEKREIDFAVMTDVLSIPGVQWTPLLEIELYVHVPKNHPLAARQTVTLDQLKGEKFANYGMGGKIPPSIVRTIDAMGFSPKFVFAADENTSVGRLVDSGGAMAFITSYEYKSLLYQFGEMPGSAALKIVDPDIRWSLGVASIRGHFRSLAAESFRRELEQYLRSLNAELCGKAPGGQTFAGKYSYPFPEIGA